MAAGGSVARKGGGLMPQSCTVCEHEKRQEIDDALAAEEPGRAVARRFGLTEAAVRRHRANHLDGEETMGETTIEGRRGSVEEARERASRELEDLRARRRWLAPAAVSGDDVAREEIAGVDELIAEGCECLDLAEEAAEELDRLEAEELRRLESEEHRAAEERRREAGEAASAAIAAVDDSVTELTSKMAAAVRAAEGLIVASGQTLPEDGRAPRGTCDLLRERALVRLETHLRRLREGDGDLSAWMEATRRAIGEALEEAARLDPQEAAPHSRQADDRRQEWFEAKGRADRLRQELAGKEFDLGEISHGQLQGVIFGRANGYDERI